MSTTVRAVADISAPDADRRAHLQAAGLQQAARFSWETAARHTRQIYEAVLRQ